MIKLTPVLAVLINARRARHSTPKHFLFDFLQSTLLEDFFGRRELEILNLEIHCEIRI